MLVEELFEEELSRGPRAFAEADGKSTMKKGKER
jgi:hypothetical protein